MHKKAAELRLLQERPDIVETINKQLLTDDRMKKGNVKGAAQIQKQDLETQQLLQYGGIR